jgi:cyclic pyranopterin phosphate synthase
MDKSPDIRMIDVGGKSVTKRQATAKGKVVMKPATFKALKDARLPKGDALSAARVAGIMAAKETPRLIPMCHPLLIDEIAIDYSLDEKTSSVEIEAMVKGTGKTGFEMEAMTAVSVCALTIYDMCKGIDPSIHIENIRMVKKSGGKSGTVVLE